MENVRVFNFEFGPDDLQTALYVTVAGCVVLGLLNIRKIINFGFGVVDKMRSSGDDDGFY